MAFAHLSSDQLAHWLDTQPSDLTIIDIRDKGSYEQSHISGATHVDNGTVSDFITSTDKTKPLVVCCYHGNSSQGAADYMSAQGFLETYSLDGGFEEWRQKSLFISTP
jgi:thiosulfate sulfurtransferase